MVGQNIGLIPVLIKHGYLGNPQTNWKMKVLMGTRSINRVGLFFRRFFGGEANQVWVCTPKSMVFLYLSPWKWPNWLVWEIPDSWTYPQIIKYPWVFEIASGKRLHSGNHHFFLGKLTINDHVPCYITGWWLQPLWKIYAFVSWDHEIPEIWKVIKFMFQTTNQIAR